MSKGESILIHGHAQNYEPLPLKSKDVYYSELKVKRCHPSCNLKNTYDLLKISRHKFVDIKPLKNYSSIYWFYNTEDYTCAGAVGCIAWKILAAEVFLVYAGCC